uniref:Uncharacterized protein LOC113795428 n=1 Tax=Dermatophagoides pteronyssinus TaxID=6956 RepID=A0A6P6Y7X9_DERPT|nr:uncharacterized protein LOC113795428 [Dermatophagoides pteronyssinus]
MMNLSNYKPCLNQMRTIIEDHDNRFYRYRHRLYMIILIILMLRICLGLLSYHITFLLDLWLNDPINYFIYNLHSKLYTNYMILLLLVFVLGIQVQYSFHFKTIDNVSFMIIYEISVKTWQHYCECRLSPTEQMKKFQDFLKKQNNDHQSKQLSRSKSSQSSSSLMSINIFGPIMNRYNYLLNRIRFQLFFNHVDKQKLESQQFQTIQATVSWQCRATLLIIQTSFEYIYCLIITLSAIILIGFPIQYYHSANVSFQFNHWNRTPWFLLDSLIIIYSLLIIIKSFTFAVYCILMFFVIHWFEADRMKQCLLQAAQECRLINRNFCYSNRSRSRIYYRLNDLRKIFHEFHQIIILYRLAYYEVWGQVSFVYLIISIPLNGICFLTLNRPDLLYEQKLAIFLMFICHSLSITIFLFGTAMQTETLHMLSKYLVPIIQSMDVKRNLLIKFKFEDWFKRLLIGPKYGPNLTLVGALTYKTILRATIIYVGFLIYILDHFQNVYLLS